MGNFYTNFTVMGCEADAVLSLAKELRREAFVIDAGRGDVILYDAICDDQDTEEIVRLGEKLSSKLALPILAALNHDDDHLLLWIFYGGKQVAYYDSILDAAPFAWALCKWCGSFSALPGLMLILGWPTFIFQVFRHLFIAKLLGIPGSPMILGHTYLTRGDLPGGFTAEDIRKV